MAANAIQVDERELSEMFRDMKKMEESLNRKEINSIQRRNAKPILEDMRSGSPSVRIAKMTAITTRQTKQPAAPPIGIRIGVINNDTALFPKFSAPATASVLEHGTEERFRADGKYFGVIIGAASTGRVKPGPWLRPSWDRNVRGFIRKTEQSYIRKVEK